MNVSQALAEITLLDKKIAKCQLLFGVAGINGKIPGFKDPEDAQAKVKASLDQYQALVANQNALKLAVAKSNLATQVTVQGKTMSVAEAVILRSSTMIYQERFTQEMVKQAGLLVRAQDLHEKKVNDLVNATISSLKGDPPPTKEFIDSLTETLRSQNKFDVITAPNLLALASEAEQRHMTLVSEIDNVLAVSNVVTQI